MASVAVWRSSFSVLVTPSTPARNARNAIKRQHSSMMISTRRPSPPLPLPLTNKAWIILHPPWPPQPIQVHISNSSKAPIMQPKIHINLPVLASPITVTALLIRPIRTIMRHRRRWLLAATMMLVILVLITLLRSIHKPTMIILSNSKPTIITTSRGTMHTTGMARLPTSPLPCLLLPHHPPPQLPLIQHHIHTTPLQPLRKRIANL